MGRILSSGQIVRSQADFYFPFNTYNRVTGLTVANVSIKLFFNNSIQNWTSLDGSSISDSSISSGSIYFNEIAGQPGYYSVRFYPNLVGFWRMSIRNDSLGSEQILEFDITSPASQSSGLIASFNS